MTLAVADLEAGVAFHQPGLHTVTARSHRAQAHRTVIAHSAQRTVTAHSAQRTAHSAQRTAHITQPMTVHRSQPHSTIGKRQHNVSDPAGPAGVSIPPPKVRADTSPGS